MLNFLILFIGVISLALICLRITKRDRAKQIEHRRLEEALKSLVYTCDGRRLLITRSEKWTDDLVARPNVYMRARQVFRIAIPGHEPLMHYNIVDSDLVGSPDVQLPTDFGRPITRRLRVTDPVTNDQVRSTHLPRLAVSMNLDQAAVDATTVELVGTEIRYAVKHDHRRVGSTDWVAFRPDSVVDSISRSTGGTRGIQTKVDHA